MIKPVISVVIPTRDRPDTLEVCLRGMRHHRSPRIEIIVQDNCSGPETQSVVTAAQKEDGRIRYFRAPHPTSQRHNFELGLAETRGDYMSIIGDDDGYCIGSLDWLVETLQARPADAVRWRLLHYVWPSLSTDGEGFANLYPALCFGGAEYEGGAPLAAKAFNAQTAGSWDNVLVYHGMISRRVYDRMRALSGNAFFPYPMPDVYAHNMVALFCDRILQVNDIVSIYGTSGYSAGSSWGRVTVPEKQGAEEGNRWIAETVADGVIAQVPWQPDIRTLRYHDFSVYKLAERYGMLGGRKLDHGIWIRAIIAEIRQNPWQLPPWFSATEKAPFDNEVFSSVRAMFDSDRRRFVSGPGLKFAPDPRIPSLRVHNVDAELPDDVEGIAVAVALVTKSLFGDLDRYRIPTVVPRWWDPSAWARAAALFFYRLAPILSSRIIRSRHLPTSLRQYLKSLKWGPNAHAKLLARHITEIHTLCDSRDESLRASG